MIGASVIKGIELITRLQNRMVNPCYTFGFGPVCFRFHKWFSHILCSRYLPVMLTSYCILKIPKYIEEKVSTRLTMKEGCTVNRTVKYIARKWTLLILLELYKGEGHTRRFTELKSCLEGITQKVLSARLKELEKEGLIEKKVSKTSFPMKSAYTLTESGQGIINIVKDLKIWALKWKIDNIKCSSQDCNECVL